MKIERRIDALYAGRFSGKERAAKARLWRVLCSSVLSRYIPAGGAVLDVGAGYCEFINNVSARRRIAIDLNPDTPLHAATGVECYQASVGDVEARIGAGSIDLAFASNVFEHLRSPEALLETLGSIRRLLRQEGRLIVLQPNVRLVGGRFWDFFDHTLPLTELGMMEALSASGFAVEECRPRFLPYTTKSRVPAWPWLLRLYLALPPAQWLFGKQMFIVARRIGET